MEKGGISAFLRRYRREQNLSREALAEALNISDAYLAALELGARKPAYGTLVNIVNTLKVSADDVLGTDSHMGKVKEITALSVELDRLDPLHRQYAISSLKLILDSFSSPDSY